MAGDPSVARAEGDGLLQRLEGGLAQQDRAAPGGRALDHGLGRDAVDGHPRLDRIDVQRARRQVVDVRAAERDHVGHQPVGVVQLAVKFGRDIGAVVPAEGFQHFRDEGRGVVLGQAALGLGLFHQRHGALGEDLPLGQDRLGLGAQSAVRDQVEPQERGEDAEGVQAQGLGRHGAEGGGMDRDGGLGQVVIAHRLHAHDGEDAAHHGQLRRRAEADGAMTLVRDPGELVGRLEPCLQGGIGGQGLGIHLGHEVHQRAIGGHFLAVHLGHGGREAGADVGGGREALQHGGGLAGYPLSAPYRLFRAPCCETFSGVDAETE